MTTHTEGPQVGPLLTQLRQICNSLGYGQVMQQVSAMWGLLDPGGEHTVGPCRASLERAGFSSGLDLLRAWETHIGRTAGTSYRDFPSVLEPHRMRHATHLAKLALAFGQTYRATVHPTGEAESDTDHTVMLGWIACELAPQGLSLGLVARMALVHDMPEVYSGDTQTLVIDAEGKAAKRAREMSARLRLERELGTHSQLVNDLRVYEAQVLPEARYIRLLDKVLPKLTHMLSACTAARKLTDRAGFVASHVAQLEELREEYPDPVLVPVLALLEEAMDAALAEWDRTEVQAPP